MISGSYISQETKEGQADKASMSVFVFMGASWLECGATII